MMVISSRKFVKIKSIKTFKNQEGATMSDKHILFLIKWIFLNGWCSYDIIKTGFNNYLLAHTYYTEENNHWQPPYFLLSDNTFCKLYGLCHALFLCLNEVFPKPTSILTWKSTTWNLMLIQNLRFQIEAFKILMEIFIIITFPVLFIRFIKSIRLFYRSKIEKITLFQNNFVIHCTSSLKSFFK